MDDAKRKAHCNICGKAFTDWDDAGNFSIERTLGFGTKHDGKRLSLHLCADCLEALIDNCAIDPTSDPNPEYSAAEAALSKAYRDSLARSVARDY